MSKKTEDPLNSDEFTRFYESKLQTEKISADSGFFIIFIIITSVSITAFNLQPICPTIPTHSVFVHDPDIKFLNKMIASLCDHTFLIRVTALAWFLALMMRTALFALLKFDLAYHFQKISVRKSGRENISTYEHALFHFLEWLPLNLGFAYVLAFGFEANLFNTGVLSTAMILTQLLVVEFSPITKSLDYEIAATQKFKEKAQKEFKSKYRRFVAKAGTKTTKVMTWVLVAFFLYSAIQIVLVPKLELGYNEALYELPELEWDQNAYFLIQGLSAPEDVPDFYSYGRQHAAKNFSIYENFKRLSMVPDRYHLSGPEAKIETELDLDNTLKANTDSWKDLECLYSSASGQEASCASWSDLKAYIAENQTLWDRYSEIPKRQYRYSSIPQLLGHKTSDLQYLAKLKAAHLVFRTEEGEYEEAIEEWLSYMTLLKEMAQSKDTFVNKALLILQVQVYLKALEKMLLIHPEFSVNYADPLKEVLNTSDGAGLLNRNMLADDWSLIEPPFAYAVGNANAVKNDLLECFQSFDKLAKYKAIEFPYGGTEPLCTLKYNSDPFKYPLITPGTYFVNIIYSLIAGGALKGEQLVERMKLLELQMTLAEAAVIKLTNHYRNDNRTFAEVMNPLSGKPFDWEEEDSYLFFEHPDKSRLYEFRLNLNE